MLEGLLLGACNVVIKLRVVFLFLLSGCNNLNPTEKLLLGHSYMVITLHLYFVVQLPFGTVLYKLVLYYLFL